MPAVFGPLAFWLLKTGVLCFLVCFLAFFEKRVSYAFLLCFPYAFCAHAFSRHR